MIVLKNAIFVLICIIVENIWRYRSYDAPSPPKHRKWDYYLWLGVAICASRQIRLQDCKFLWSLLYLKRIKWYLSFFAWGQSSSEDTIWDCQFLLGLGSCVCHPIRLQNSFIIGQYLRKESIDTLIFLNGDSYQVKVASETTTFGWVRPGVFLIQSV